MANSAFLAGGFTDLSIGVTPITGGVPYSILTTGPLGNTLQQTVPGANGDILSIVGGIPTWIASPLGNFWSISGNAGTNPALDFVGTSDAQDFNIRSNNTVRATFSSSGLIQIVGDTTGNPAVPAIVLGNAGGLATDPVILKLNTAGLMSEYIGGGSPEGVVTADSGSLYHNVSSGFGSLYVKTDDGDNTGWIELTGGNDWHTTGNAGTSPLNPGTDFVGTTDGVDFIVGTNGTERMRFDASGNFIYLGDGTAPISLIANGGGQDILIQSATNQIISTGNPTLLQSVLGVTDSVVRFQSVNGTTEYFNGIGSPEGVVAADAGSIYSDITNGGGALYVKLDNIDNTDWQQLLTANNIAGTLFNNYGIGTSFGNAYYSPLGGAGLTTIESAVQILTHAMQVTSMKVRVFSNTHDGVTTVQFRVNGASVGPSITIGAGATGNFTDTTATTVAADDLVTIQVDTTASTTGSINIQSIQTKAI